MPVLLKGDLKKSRQDAEFFLAWKWARLNGLVADGYDGVRGTGG
jgi:hypothetical protein